MYIPDNYDLWEAYDKEQNTEKRPDCDEIIGNMSDYEAESED